ncbi:hypothetical protein [Pseudonocardia sp. TRM90224]|uniref:hypothetical protein n=1 Tax=Pseudonocardia sp. TRM90224 TaxID=2812678 RepID=UPI001E511767|nr:hypothetical protein [Pseudonocardia sp. TRM90224]
MSHPNQPARHAQHHRPDGLTAEERAVADAAVARMRAERDVAEADARGRLATDPYGLPRHPLPAPTRTPPRNGLGLAAVIVAPVGILFGLIPLTGFIAVVCALIAIPLALAGRSRVRKGHATNGGTTITGLVLAVAALALGIWGITIVFGAVDKLANDLAGPAPVGAPAVPGSAPLQQPTTGAGTAAFGERVAFDNGLAVQITEPKAYRPGRFAAGHDGDRAVTFDVTVSNDSDKPFDAVLTQVRATHGGRPVSKVFDAERGSENPQGTVLPGKSMTFSVALSLGGPTGELQVEVAPTFLGDPAIFVGEV